MRQTARIVAWSLPLVFLAGCGTVLPGNAFHAMQAQGQQVIGQGQQGQIVGQQVSDVAAAQSLIRMLSQAANANTKAEIINQLIQSEGSAGPTTLSLSPSGFIKDTLQLIDSANDIQAVRSVLQQQVQSLQSYLGAMQSRAQSGAIGSASGQQGQGAAVGVPGQGAQGQGGQVQDGQGQGGGAAGSMGAQDQGGGDTDGQGAQGQDAGDDGDNG